MPISHQHHDLDRVHLQRALSYAAEYLRSQRAELVIVAVGGAVNTILLRSRESTHDVDFFLPDSGSGEARLLEQAALAAEARSSIPLGGDWLNNSTSLYIPRNLRQELSREATAQGDIVFQQRGLTVLAAPWIYALCAKIERLGGHRRRRYDLTDAATYLERYNSRHRGRPVEYTFLVEKARHYGTSINAEVCREVDAAYVKRYHRHGIQT